ncbi:MULTISPECIES: DUF5694 domain-containing protein [Streptococcus]|uniref:DUF5694 domain-containing protein n=1 Tax=Streptococcus caledonicus TaxID=2614158 RepID=A0ABW0UE10_9STRE|nr:DUF5694 domain-containing protein [Streptococcus sp. S784/96/1]
MKKIMILGTFHMKSQNDLHNVDNPDQFLYREKEMIEVIDRLSEFCPTKIMVEWEHSKQDKLDSYFQNHLNRNIVSSDEIIQLAFPLAKRFQLTPKAVDWFEEGVGLYSFGQVAEALDSLPDLKSEIENLEIPQKDFSKPIRQLLAELNSTEITQQIVSYYTNIARVSTSDDIGIGWLLWWYQRNLSIFKNILEELEENDRAILLIGLSHKGILENLLRDSGCVEVAEVLDYLG